MFDAYFGPLPDPAASRRRPFRADRRPHEAGMRTANSNH